MHIMWRRTVIGGQTAPYDFEATVDEKGIGRITRIPHGPKEGCWSWALHLSVPGVDYQRLGPLHGVEQSKAEAIDSVRRAFDLVSNAKLELDLAGGKEPAGVFENVCSHPGCPHWSPPGDLCYKHAAEARRTGG